MISSERLSDVTRYINNLYVAEEGGFRFQDQSVVTTLSTSFAVQSMHLIGRLDELDDRKERIVRRLADHRFDDTDYLCDPRWKPGASPRFKDEYILSQFTYFGLIALDMLDVHLDRLGFMEPLLSPDAIREWFSNVKWGDFWYESNRVMFLMYFLAYLEKYGRTENRQAVEDCIETCFEILDANQDPNTGFWGTDQNDNNMMIGYCGACHVLLFYDYWGREIHFPDMMVANTLKLHVNNGLMLTVQGGACEDYDAVEIYLRCLAHAPSYRSKVLSKVEIMADTVSAMCQDGGWSYGNRPSLLDLLSYPSRSSLRKLLRKLLRRPDPKYRYSDWAVMTSWTYKPDLWGTFFRLMILAGYDIIKDGVTDYAGYSLPGWGYLDSQ